jgi:hypothetical protein
MSNLRDLKALVVSGCCVLFSGCSSLSVKMDILDGDYVRAIQKQKIVTEQLPRILSIAQTGTSDSRLRQAWGNLLTTDQDSELAITAKVKASKNNVAFSDAMKEQFELCEKERDEVSKERALKLDNALKELAANFGPNTLVSSLTPNEIDLAHDLLNRQYYQWKALKDSARKCSKALSTIAPKEDTKPTPGSYSDNDIADPSLFSSVYAPRIVGADDSLWKGRFNFSEGKTQLGAGDLAIYMTPSGHFAVKGLTFDPSSTATLLTRIAVQALASYSLNSGTALGSLSESPPPSSEGAGGATSPDSSAKNAYLIGANVNTKLNAKLAELKDNQRMSQAASLRLALATLSVATLVRDLKLAANSAEESAEIKRNSKAIVDLYKALSAQF